MLSSIDISSPGGTLSNTPCLVQRHSETVRLETPRRFEKIVFWVPTDDSATEGAPLSHLPSAISPDYSSVFFFD
jgi:hypothetical protein